MSVSSLPSVATSGLMVSRARLEVSAHNTANASTPGFMPQEVIQEARTDGGVRYSVRQTQLSQDRLETQMVERHVALYHFEANVLSLRHHDRMLGTLLDLSA